MKVNTKELVEALTRFQNLNLTDDKQGEIQGGLIMIDDDKMYGANYSGSAVITLDKDIKINRTVRFKELFDLLSKIKTKEVNIEQNKKDKSRLIITTNKTNAELNTSFPPVVHNLNSIKGKWVKLPNDFISGIKLCSSSTIKDNTQIFSCLNITAKTISSCDNIRISKHSWKKHIDIKNNVLIPSENTTRVIKFEPSSLLVNKDCYYFKNKYKDILGIRKMELEEYPDINTFLKVKTKNEINLPLKAKDSLQRAGIFGSDEVTGETIVNITVKENKLIFNAQSEVGKIRETIKIDYKGKEIKFSMYPDALSQIFNYDSDKDHVTIKVGDSSILFEGRRFKYMICIVGEDKKK